MKRRQFIRRAAAASLAAAGFPRPLFTAGLAEKKVVAGVMGLERGKAHVAALLALAAEAEVAYVCDADEERLRAGRELAEKAGAKPRAVQDFRRILEDPAVDALFIAAPNHWHAPATILACTAGKHVYVEKPASHNPREGELMVAAAKKHRRVVQMGNQRRSWPGMIEGIAKLRAGAIGRLTCARSWYTNERPSIRKGKQVPVPARLDYDLWQGPAPERPYLDNVVHYNWHWRWHWGNGELGNNGIHALDVVRWGLGVDYPRRVTCGGGRYAFDDDQETPDTCVATYDFGTCAATWEGSSCHPRKAERPGFVTFYGEGGTLVFDDPGYKVFDPAGKQIGQGSGPANDVVHVANFLDCLRTGKQPNADVEDCQKSTLLCHLGNIAYRTGRTITFDPEKRRITGDPEADALWGREYRKGWEVTV
jgi:predicted dehydrogenase